MDEKIRRIALAEKFFADGDPRGMRAVAREVFDMNPKSAEGPAIMAEAALYLGNFDEAEMLAHDALLLESNNLRARLVLGGIAAEKFDLKEEFSILRKVIDDSRKNIYTLKNSLLESRRKIFAVKKPGESGKDVAKENEIEMLVSLNKKILCKALCFISNGLYLAGDPQAAADSLREASTLTDNEERAAELYSKHLFFRNYRGMSPGVMKETAKKYNDFFANTIPFSHAKHNYSPNKKLKIGYISPDFRQHAVANFVLPLLKDFDTDNFSVTCYNTGKRDSVTEKLKRNHVSWRDLNGRNLRTITRIISEDKPDILVDLSGHTQNSCLPIMAFKLAPVQISAIGYTATTGLNATDFFISDKVCLPEPEQSTGFTEKILRTQNCCLCYAPGVIRDMPPAGVKAPVLKNGFVTFGSFNNFAKVSDDVLYVWRAILDELPDAVLVIKNKICSIESGREILLERLKKLSFPVGRVEMRPYSPDYLEQYRDIDIALDTFPYNGGLTTCEALYMGVPVIALRGRSHGARLAASILTSADLKELIAQNQMEYVKKAVQVGKKKELIAGYHAGLREHLLKSALMDSRGYMSELEKCYREAWKIFCEKSPE